MTKSRSGTPSNTRAKRDEAVQWPKTAMSTAKPVKRSKVGFSLKLKRERRHTNEQPSDGSMNAMYDTDHDANLEPFVALAIGHIILDDPTHQLYQQHLSALLDTCSSRARFQELVNWVRGKADELGMPGKGDEAVAALSQELSDRIAESLMDGVTDQVGLADVVARVLKHQAEEHGQECDLTAFLGLLRERLGRGSYSVIKAEEVVEAAEPVRISTGMAAFMPEGGGRLSDSPLVYSNDWSKKNMEALRGRTRAVLRTMALPAVKVEPRDREAAIAVMPPATKTFLSESAAKSSVVVTVDSVIACKRMRRYCEVGFRQYDGYTGVQLYGPADDRQWLVTLKSARHAKRAAGGAQIKKQVGKIVLYEAENGYN
ncbi:hypothetical protein LTR10_012520 [Elasticomyces elasticus]|nr:hypothetical protein LTR10_012520 [Elasticomyces elasticus]KAK4965994.1 hypothetical protein LTR42_012008 [Elasticomyces elasticus]